MKKAVITILAAMFCLLAAIYCLNPGRRTTLKVLQEKGKQTVRDMMLSSQSVTSIATDRRELMWIGTSAGLNVYDGKSYIQFGYDVKDTTALPDDYINVLHLDRKGRMWVGTQNGLARYVGAYRFHRVALPDHHDNIIAIEDSPEKHDSLAILVSDGNQTYRIGDDEKITPSSHSIQPNNLQASLPADHSILRKPVEVVTATFRDLGGNLWVGYRNAGVQIISQNRIAYKEANDNALSDNTKGISILTMATVGKHVLAGTGLRVFAYDEKNKHLDQTLFRDLFDSLPKPRQINLNNMVGYDDEHLWLVSEQQVLSCRINNERIEVLAKSPLFKSGLGLGLKVENHLYVSSEKGRLLRFEFGKPQPELIRIPRPYFDHETKLAKLNDGNILLFMRGMHLAVLSPDTGKIREMKVTDMPREGSLDPAFAKQDSYGNVWLGTQRDGLYLMNKEKTRMHRVNILNDVHIQALVEDTKRQVWVTTIRDVFFENFESKQFLMNSLLSASQDQDDWQYFSNSACILPSGDVVLGSSDGCKFMPPEAMQTNFLRTQAGIHASEMLAVYGVEVEKNNGEVLAITDEVAHLHSYTFAHDENNLKFNFYYPNFSRRSALMCQYKLEGYDRDWQVPTYGREAHYAHLPAGTYTFRLRLISSTDKPALAERKVEITVMHAPWWSSAAWLLYFSIVLGILFYLNTFYLRARTNHLLLLQEQRELEREKQAKEMNMRFFANIAHEFRNPLTIIAGPLMSLNADKALPESVHRILTHVCMSVNRMLRLIDQMLDFNQLETDELRLRVSEVDAAEELRQQVASFKESARVKGIRLELTIKNGNYHVWLDCDKLEKIMSNLFTNALKYTAPGGIICIQASADEERLEVSVFNSGQPMEEDKMQNVFKRYYQLSDSQNSHQYGWGTGIGLYYVKRLVELHHGEIYVKNIAAVSETSSEASLRNGVEFCFSLPTDKSIYNKVEIVAQEKRVMLIPLEVNNEEGRALEVKSEEGRVKNSLAGKDDSAGNPSPSGKNLPRILIVDDDVDVADYLHHLFAPDYEVVNRYSAEEALADLEEVKPDIILSDIIMGKMSGFEFCKVLKGNLSFSHIPVVLITAMASMHNQIDGLKLGAVAYITKPFDPAYLKALVKSQLQNMQTLRQRLGESTKTDSLAENVADTLSPQDRKFMDEVYEMMEKLSAQQDLNVNSMCRDMFISPSKFNYKIKELTGETPGIFFRKYKLNKAAQMLHDGQYSISEVAVLTGFSTAAHFSVAFKKQFGVSPSEYQ